jgi:hypothetical protein
MPRVKTSISKVLGRNFQIPPPLSRRGPCGVDGGMDVNALVHVKVAIMPPTEGVEHVVGVFGAEPGKDDAFTVGLSAWFGGGEMDEVGTVGDVDAAVADLQAGRDQQPDRRRQ